MSKIYRGWIGACESDATYLKRLGITLGDYNHEDQSFDDCEVPETAMDELDNYWGTFIWYLVPEETEMSEITSMQGIWEVIQGRHEITRLERVNAWHIKITLDSDTVVNIKTEFNTHGEAMENVIWVEERRTHDGVEVFDVVPF